MSRIVLHNRPSEPPENRINAVVKEVVKNKTYSTGLTGAVIVFEITDHPTYASKQVPQDLFFGGNDPSSAMIFASKCFVAELAVTFGLDPQNSPDKVIDQLVGRPCQITVTTNNAGDMEIDGVYPPGI